MVISIDPAAIPGILAVYEAFALTLLATVFSRKRFLTIMNDDLRAIRRYFFSFFILVAAVPIAALVVLSAKPLEILGSLGLRAGNGKLGLALVLASIPVAVLAGAIGSKDPAMRSFYPLSKKACVNLKTFAAYEIRYFCFYYTAWEFVFRGVLFFPVASAAGLLPALALQAIASTLFHLGHPDTEIYAALGAGFAFGLMAWATGSMIYPILIHAAIGISTDTFIFRKILEERSAT